MSLVKSTVWMLTAACVLAAGSTSVRAAAILSNLPADTSSASSGGTNLGVSASDGFDRQKAVGLTIGGSSLSFVSMEIIGSTFNGTLGVGDGGTFIGGIFSSVGGAPGVQLATFTPISIGDDTEPQFLTFTIAGGFTLLANTSYWFVLDGDTVSDLLWNGLISNTAPTPTGVTFDGYRFQANGGGWNSSSTFNAVRINADSLAVPEPATAGLLGLGALVMAMRRGRKC
ncbi:MAG: PEP-CTERM sorting domain-containing protein [Planctomycetes bacterium]|nr:PEP-CTERM sorting domain-containing protein [Planctomycetota bacterium]